MNTENNRYKELDCLRGIAAFSVVLFHFTFGYDHGNGSRILSEDKFYFTYGYFGVHLFFLISGFVIFMTLEKSNKLSDFLVSRFSRLYPAYWACIIISVALTTALSVPFQQGIFSLKQIFVNFTMLQYWFKIKDVDGAYWTLAIELTFYCWMYFVFLIKKQQYISWFCLAWLTLAVLFSSYNIPFENYINVIFILKHAPLFVGGITFFRLKNNPTKLYLHCLVLLSISSEYLLFYQQNSPIIFYTIIFGFYTIFYLFIYNKLSFIRNKVLLFLGTISYSLYLIHENIGTALIYWLKTIIDSQFFYLPISVLSVVLLASGITFYIEKPAMFFIRNFYKNRHERE